jgi:hypothetical protein
MESTNDTNRTTGTAYGSATDRDFTGTASHEGHAGSAGREYHGAAGTAPNRSVLDLFTQLVDNMSFLFRKEIELAKAEMSEKAGEVGAGAAKAAVGGVLMIPAIVMLLWAVVAWLETIDIPIRWGTLIVGVIVALIGFMLLKSGMNAASAANLKPRRTANQLQRDAAVVKEQVR